MPKMRFCIIRSLLPKVAKNYSFLVFFAFESVILAWESDVHHTQRYKQAKSELTLILFVLSRQNVNEEETLRV